MGRLLQLPALRLPRRRVVLRRATAVPLVMVALLSRLRGLPFLFLYMLLLAAASISRLTFAFDGNSNDNPCWLESGVSIYEVQCLQFAGYLGRRGARSVSL